jgi:molybdopterin converting factor small subunit
VSLRRDPDCPVCGEQPTISESIDYVEFCHGRPTQAWRRFAFRPRFAARPAASARCRPRVPPARAARRSDQPLSGLHTQLVEGDEIAAFVNVYLEGVDVRRLEGLDTPVDDGSTVILLPSARRR